MKKLAILLSLTLGFSFIAPGFVSYAAINNETKPEGEVLLDEEEFLYDIGYEDPTIDESYGNDMEDYESTNEPSIQPFVLGLILKVIVKNGVKLTKHIYKSIKYAPKYPAGFKAVQNGTKNFTVKNKELLDELRQIESGTWKKVYKDGYDKNNNKISIHYFQSESGLVYDVKVKKGWSV